MQNLTKGRCVSRVQTQEGAALLGRFLSEQISSFIEIESEIGKSPMPRVERLHTLFASIIEDAISIKLLGDASRLNQAYVLSRALLERITNFCFLQLCTDGEFRDYVDYSLNKAGRRVDRSIEVDGQVRVRVALKDGSFELPPEVQAAVAKFTSERGREKTRWTNVSLQERAGVIEAKLPNSGLFVSLLTIYADASEALHGTLYGAAFHLGVYDYGAVPYDQASLDSHRYSTLSFLYLMAGGAMDTLLALLSLIGEPNAPDVAKASRIRFKQVAVDCELV
ncbi:DUF5677 domain-containing protein [Paraburkholderia sediminicola]|uniref:DUF5677 domain-containing protein n=1 Tax=Paraburkholderia sediminicola TaxID=458836 RepID=UPI0038B7836B